MSERINDGGPAFPAKRVEEFPLYTMEGELMDVSTHEVAYAGMTLRDYFAGQAPDMPHGWSAVPFIGPAPAGTIYPYYGPKLDYAEMEALEVAARREFLLWEAKALAAWRYVFADAMIAAREGARDET